MIAEKVSSRKFYISGTAGSLHSTFLFINPNLDHSTAKENVNHSNLAPICWRVMGLDKTGWSWRLTRLSLRFSQSWKLSSTIFKFFKLLMSVIRRDWCQSSHQYLLSRYVRRDTWQKNAVLTGVTIDISHFDGCNVCLTQKFWKRCASQEGEKRCEGEVLSKSYPY